MSTDVSTRTNRRTLYFGLAVLAGLVLGALLGFVAKQTETAWLTTTLKTIGNIFTSLLQFTVIPLVFTAIVVGVTSLRGLGGGRTAARLGGKTLLWFGITSLIAVLIGIAVGLISGAGKGVSVQPSEATVKRLADRAQGDWLTVLNGLVPDNLFTAFSNGEVLQVVFVAVLVGIATFVLGDRAAPFVAFNQAAFDIIQKVLGWIIRLAPIGVLGLIGTAFATYGNQFFKPLLSLIAAVYIAALLVLFVVYPVLLRVVGKVSPRTFFAKSWTALQFAFVSRSSGATLPLSRQTAVNLGVEPGYAGFAVPLGTTTKMDGCAALYPAIATIFIANLFGVSLSFWQYVGIVAVAVFGAFATAGTTGWFTMLTLTLSTIGLPPEVVATGVAIVYGVDPILDMIRTATNVAGQITVPVLVARSENLLDDEVLNSPSGPPLLDDQPAPTPAPEPKDKDLVTA
ncbi:dicarboxylate/amino acid:cation symporter [Actinokineospora globicatena]|uniref:Sodium:proton antiporter n=1 Tax=Actinokineospora globicatena TaxID=103729 RepID=A0A9W6QV24_9PSEU|nr:dicarboxylate/amino acid:cation symporter [Actinokineospora globicatena]MCP2302057.1 Na+/H+-dicarboxylate symporter [Actinokineospora globicatena]GLW76281.1 sodium:proton antiporter [Actinokineospora globicatena]GLW83117.1 sodium:proton antiporter [Actinokineospora globicatena]GLW95395.1 sodium:proton antiporter [Actinokineospora globicatena]